MPGRVLAGFMVAAGIHGAMAVGFGAFAAHGAGGLLSPVALDWLRTGSSYQLWHAVALLGIGALSGRGSNLVLGAAGSAFCFGAFLFSGSLYLLAFAGPHWLVFATPAGGALLIAGWLLVAIAGCAAFRRRDAGKSDD